MLKEYKANLGEHIYDFLLRIIGESTEDTCKATFNGVQLKFIEIVASGMFVINLTYK